MKNTIIGKAKSIGWLRDFEAEFFCDNGCVIREDCLEEWKGTPSVGMNKAILENFINHTHFDWDFSGSALFRWRTNQALAISTRSRWLQKLAARFPGVRFCMPIHNELVVGENLVNVMATLRFWSERNDGNGDLASYFIIDNELDLIACGEDTLQPFVNWEEFFTGRGEIRKSILKKYPPSPDT